MASLFVVLAGVLLIAQGTAAGQPPQIRMSVVEGEGAFNNIQRGLARNVTVEVRDLDNRAVQGAEVTFKLPMDGAGARFSDGSLTYVAVTGGDGRASTSGMRPNGREGRFNIKIVAKKDAAETSIVVAQSNTLAGGIPEPVTAKKSSKKWWILGLIGAGAAGGTAAAVLGGSDKPDTVVVPATGISIGTITVGGPR
jgi:hypothetical protein